MAMYVKENKLYIFVADSDAVDKNRIAGSTNTKQRTGNYCPPESREQNDLFYEFLEINSVNDHTSRAVFLNTSILKKYKDQMIKKIKNKFSNVYKGKMIGFENLCDSFIAKGNFEICSYLYLTGDRPYMQFEQTDEWKEFLNLLYSETTTIVLEKKDDRYEVYPMFHPIFAKPNEIIKIYGIDDSYIEEDEEMNQENCTNIRLNPRENEINPLNTIIYGAPGTGKTYHTVDRALAIIDNQSLEEFENANNDRATNLAKYKELVNKGRIVFTTFHQNYGYEDFIQGLRPDKNSESMKFDIVDGVFKKIADRALNDGGNNYVIIIDEINRANISKVFGELITLIEPDKRWGELNEMSTTLQSGDIFAVPNNLYIIGTMNSADKSISLIDVALRRRFVFEEQRPNSSLIEDEDLKKVLECINKNLSDELESSDLLIGHSYFMNKNLDDLVDILNNSIIPLLYEYFYDNKKKVIKLLENIQKDCGKDIITIKDDKMGRVWVE